MFFNRAIFSCLACLFCALYSPTASAIAAVFVSHESAHPGDSATVDFELTIHEDMTDFSFVVHYETDVVSVNDVGAGDLLSGWGDEGFSWSDDSAAGEITIIGSAHGLAPVGWISGPLLAITFDVSDDATFDTVSPVTLDPATFYGPGGTEILAFFEFGSITVTDPDAPPEPDPITATMEIPDMTVHPGDEVMVDFIFTNDVPVMAIVFTLWVDPTVMTLGDEEGIELSERASGGEVHRLPVVDGAETYAFGMPVEGPWLEPGDGWLLRLPYTIAEDILPGHRPFGITNTDVIAMIEGVPTYIEVDRVAGVLTIEEAAEPDTGGAVPGGDTGISEDTGETDEDTGEDGGSDDGGLDTGPGDASDSEDLSPTEDDKSGCNCSSGGTTGGLWAVVLAGFVGNRRRRRDQRPSA
jgi:MYXO-CTERM domain-containing protein